MAAFGLWNLHFEIPAYSLNDFRRGLEATKNEKSSQGIGRGARGDPSAVAGHGKPLRVRFRPSDALVSAAARIATQPQPNRPRPSCLPADRL